MGATQERGVAVLTPRVGQGKDAFQNSIVHHLEYSSSNPAGVPVHVLEPSMMNPATQAVWSVGRKFYELSAKNKLVADRYGSVHAGSHSARDFVTGYGGHEFVKKAKARGDVILAMHGLMAKGVRRYFPEGDVIAEPSAADSLTTSFVPLPETKKHLESFGNTGEVRVHGFIVPEEIKNSTRLEERKEALLNGEQLKVAFMTTGQLSKDHLSYFYRNVLRDMKDDICAGRIKVSAYLWKSFGLAQELASAARGLGLSTMISNAYEPESPSDLTISYNQDPDRAVNASFKMAEEADILITPLGERLPWAAYIPMVALTPIRGNVKMIANTEWAEKHGLVRRGAASFKEFVARFNSQSVREYYERADEVFSGGEVLNGAENTANYMIDVARCEE